MTGPTGNSPRLTDGGKSFEERINEVALAPNGVKNFSAALQTTRTTFPASWPSWWDRSKIT